MTKDMTQGSPLKLILAFAVPLMLGSLFQQFYNLADTIIVGRFVGVDALAAVGSVGGLNYLVLGFVNGIACGFSIPISWTFGAKDYREMRRYTANTVWLSLFFAVVLTVVTVALTRAVLVWTNTPDNIIDIADIYIRTIFWGIPFTLLYNVTSALMRALGDSKRPLYYLIISSLTNIVLDLLFIGAFHWGVWAAAVATTISQAVSMILCMIHLMKKGTIYQVELKKLRIDREMLGQIIRYGLPSGVQNSVIGFANVIVQSNINSFGKVAMAAYGAYSKLEGFAFLPVTSFTMALTTFVGQNLGAGLHDRAKKGSRFGIIASVVIAEIIGVTMYLLAPQLVALFSPTPEVVELGTRQMRTTALFFCLLAYSHAIASICRGAGKAFVPMVIMLLFWCVVRIAYITIVMGIVHEIQYIYMAYPITWSLSSIVYFLYYHFSDWVHGFDKKPAKPQET